MIEETIIKYLSEQLSVPVYMEEPKDVPNSYVIIEKTGESRSAFLYHGTIAIQSYGTSLYETAKLDALVRSAMFNIIDLDDITRCDLNASYNFTDTTTKRYRYQSVYDLIYYGD